MTPSPQPGSFRILIAVVFGFFAYGATAALGFALMLAIGGVDRVLEPGAWTMTTGAQIASVLIAAVGGFFGGSLCRIAASSMRISVMFAIMVCVLLGVQGGIRMAGTSADSPRTAEHGGYGSLTQNVRPGPVALIGVPLAAAACSLAGAAAIARVQRFFKGR